MLFKWWWRYLDEGQLLRKIIVNYCYDVNEETRIWNHEGTKSNGQWKDIVGISKKNSLIEQLSKEGWRMCVGNGIQDKATWMFGTNGKYSIRSFVLAATGRLLGTPTVNNLFDNSGVD
ncbi:hypothetical protein PIB30_076185 [Stylosanthes scabra]|uniref:Uncharacterized protein n=1 Tax=Stylosanthes scabra TaxID=79078 RepID=A0ABU6XQ51_9FABA|nr:hypothetical protein [Stylosanthes scabra]